jgi:hypothetical protein
MQSWFVQQSFQPELQQQLFPVGTFLPTQQQRLIRPCHLEAAVGYLKIHQARMRLRSHLPTPVQPQLPAQELLQFGDGEILLGTVFLI